MVVGSDVGLGTENFVAERRNVVLDRYGEFEEVLVLLAGMDGEDRFADVEDASGDLTSLTHALQTITGVLTRLLVRRSNAPLATQTHGQSVHSRVQVLSRQVPVTAATARRRQR